MEKAKRTYKDGLFRLYMREPGNCLELCRGIHEDGSLPGGHPGVHA